MIGSVLYVKSEEGKTIGHLRWLKPEQRRSSGKPIEATVYEVADTLGPSWWFVENLSEAIDWVRQHHEEYRRPSTKHVADVECPSCGAKLKLTI